MNVAARDPLEDFVRKLVACIRLLLSNRAGEVEAARSGVLRLLSGAKPRLLTALADHIENGGSTLSEKYKEKILTEIVRSREAAYAEGVRATEARFRPDGKLGFVEVALYVEQHINRFPPDKHEFIRKMALYAREDLEATQKQGKYLFDIFVQYLGGRIR